MRILKNTETAGILFLFFICFNFVSCKSTEQTTDASQSKIQDELDGLSISLDQPKKYSREQQLFIDIKNTSDFVKIGDELDYKITVDDEAKEVISSLNDMGVQTVMLTGDNKIAANSVADKILIVKNFTAAEAQQGVENVGDEQKANKKIQL